MRRSPFAIRLGRGIQEARVAAHKTPAQAARYMRRSEAWYTMLEAGRSVILVGDFFSLLRFFKADSCELLIRAHGAKRRPTRR